MNQIAPSLTKAIAVINAAVDVLRECDPWEGSWPCSMRHCHEHTGELEPVRDPEAQVAANDFGTALIRLADILGDELT